MLPRLKNEEKMLELSVIETNNFDPGIQMGYRGVDLRGQVAKGQCECLADNNFRRTY